MGRIIKLIKQLHDGRTEETWLNSDHISRWVRGDPRGRQAGMQEPYGSILYDQGGRQIGHFQVTGEQLAEMIDPPKYDGPRGGGTA